MPRSQESANYSTNAVSSLREEAKTLLNEISDSVPSNIWRGLDNLFDKTEDGDFRVRRSESLDTIFYELRDIVRTQEKLDDNVKSVIKILLYFSIISRSYYSSEDSLAYVQKILLYVEALLRERDDDDYTWFEKLVIGYLSESQKNKLFKAWAPGRSTSELETDEEVPVSASTSLFKRFMNPVLNALSPNHQEESELSPPEIQIKDQVVPNLIRLFTEQPDRRGRAQTVKHSSSGFLGLDRSGKEAACWRELELSRSESKEYARLAGAIAWKIWLFKEPLLKQYCLDQNMEYKDLSFSQKAEQTKKAIAHFSESEMTEILDSAVELELEKRKKHFEIEERDEFKGKRVSMGIELEITNPLEEVAIIYKWYENLDRATRNDNLFNSKKIEDLFGKLSLYRDSQEEHSKLEHQAEKAQKLVGQELPEEITEENITQRRQTLLQLVSGMVDAGLKKDFSEHIEQAETNVFDSELIFHINNILQKDLQDITKKLEAAKRDFNSLYSRNFELPDYDEYSNSSPYSDHDFINQTGWVPSESSKDVKVLFDIFKHHMGQAQALGHGHTGDSYGEHALEYVSGDFKDPYGLLSREIWELAKAGFHDFELDVRPLHITIGFKDRIDKGFKISDSVLNEETSLIYVALTATGYGFRKYITDFKQENEGNIEEATISHYGDTGRAEIIRDRDGWGSRIKNTREYRGFAPSKADFPRLVKKLGALNTAMIPYVLMQDERNIELLDDIDLKLAAIYEDFRQKVTELYSKYDDLYKNFPSLENANSWKIQKDSDFESDEYEAMMQNNKNKKEIANFYKAVATSIDQPEGFVADMKKIVRDAEQAINVVFA